MRQRAALLWIAAIIISCGLRPSQGSGAAPFYSGKTLQLMVGYSAGGSDDLWVRLIAQHLGSYIPGHPTVVPVNVPGAGSLVLANQIYNTLPQDGTAVGLINRGMPFETLLDDPGAHFDPLKFNYIGSPDRDTGTCAARTDAPAHTLSQLRTTELVVGATGSGADTEVYPKVLSAFLGLKFKVVGGYPGSHDVYLAIERGEVQGECVVYDTLARTPLFKAGKLAILLQVAKTPDSRIPNVPLASNLAQGELNRQALALFTIRASMGRPIVAGPRVPQDRVAILQKAFAETMRDPNLIAQAERAGLHAGPIAPGEMRELRLIPLTQVLVTMGPADDLTSAGGRRNPLSIRIADHACGVLWRPQAGWEVGKDREEQPEPTG